MSYRFHASNLIDGEAPGILTGDRQYRRVAHLNTTHRRRQNFYALPRAHQALLSAPPFSILATLDRVDDAIDANADIARAILDSGLAAFGLAEPDPAPHSSPSPPPIDAPAPPWHNHARPADLDKARSTIRQLVRDWSAAGAAERAAHYGPLLADLGARFDRLDGAARGRVRVLVPGAGLGRLVFEVGRAGFAAEGNELAFHALLAGHWALNALAPRQTCPLYPHALAFSNHADRAAQLRRVDIPDVHPATELARAARDVPGWSGSMSVAAADFTVLYADAEHAGVYDAVATCFFVDTAPNVVRYVETIRHALKAGGCWANVGPLLWHFEERALDGEDGKEPNGSSHDSGSGRDRGIGEPGSVELTAEELILLVEAMGFRVEKREILDSGCGYIQDPHSMLQNSYRLLHFVAEKIS